MQAADLPANARVLRYLSQGAEAPTVAVVQPPPADLDRRRLGAHPDVVDRLWDVLNAGLGADCRALVAGGAALVDPASGRILAAALGTQYALWLTPVRRADALAAGYRSIHEFRTVGRTVDLGVSFGRGWVFGDWDDVERGWLVESRAAANL